jgi:hypothetical protein
MLGEGEAAQTEDGRWACLEKAKQLKQKMGGGHAMRRGTSSNSRWEEEDMLGEGKAANRRWEMGHASRRGSSSNKRYITKLKK